MAVSSALQRVRRSFSPTVLGVPKSEVEFAEQAFCRIRWICALWFPLAILSWFAVISDLNQLTWTAATLSHALMVCSIPLVLLSGNRLRLRRVHQILFLAALLLLTGAGLMMGGSNFYPGYVGGFGFVFAVMLGLAPVSLPALISLFLWGIASAAGSAIWIHRSLFSTPHIASMATPICLGIIGILLNRWSYRNHRQLALSQLRLLRQARELDREKKRADQLLERALTRPVAEELRRHKVFRPTTAEICVIETDIVDFSGLCERVPARVVLQELQRFSKAFEESCLAYNVQPLHTWGDANVAVAGLGWDHNAKRRIPEVDCILAMLDLCRHMMIDYDPNGTAGTLIWPARIGIHCGPVMMAVLDGARLRFDIWGDTVNIAARLEQGSRPRTIHVSEKLLHATRGLFDYGPIREVEVKKTVIRAAELQGIRAEFQNELGLPNDLFWVTYFDPNCGMYPPNPEGSQAPDRTARAAASM